MTSSPHYSIQSLFHNYVFLLKPNFALKFMWLSLSSKLGEFWNETIFEHGKELTLLLFSLWWSMSSQSTVAPIALMSEQEMPLEISLRINNHFAAPALHWNTATLKYCIALEHYVALKHYITRKHWKSTETLDSTQYTMLVLPNNMDHAYYQWDRCKSNIL